MASSISDLLHAARALLKARTFTAVCVVSLGLGLSVVIALLLFMRMVIGTPPGVRDERLAEVVIRPSGQLRAQAGNAIIDTWSFPDYLDVRDAARGMTVTAWSRGEGLFRPDQGEAIPVATMYVSSNYFSTIGVTLPLGPGFTPADDASHAEPEAVIGYRVWDVRFNRDPDIIGRTININQTDYVVVGVAPEHFRGHVGGLNDAYSQLWVPLSRHPRLTAADSNARLARDVSWIRLVARLSDDTTVERADAIVQSAMAALAARYPSTNRDRAGGVEAYFPPGARMRAQVGFARMMLFGLSGIVLLVVGLNISGMMLVRSAMRQRELAVRLAMGASRWRLVQYHLTEALVLAVFGGCFASALLFGGPVIVAWAFEMWGPALDLFKPDLWLALQCIGLCFVTSLVLGVLPAIRFSRPSIITALKNDSAGSGQRVGRLQRFTAAAQAGLAVPFLVISGVYFEQARVTAFADLGFEPHGLYAARLNLSGVARTDEDLGLLLRTMQDNLKAAPGVVSVSAADGLPLDFIYRNARVARDGESAFVTAHATRVAPGYLETIGTRLLAGRTIEANDREGAEPVVLLSEPLARQLFPGGDPLGARVAFALPGGERQTYTVVGVTADLVSTQMGNPRPQLFVSLAQHPSSTVLLVARSTPSDPSMRSAFHNAIADGLRMISAQPLRQNSAQSADALFRELITGEGLVEFSRSDILTMAGAGGLAAAVALVLATFGVYGVIAFMVATRTREIGIRVALGASRGRVVRDVLRDALTLVVPGIGLGLVLAVLWVRRVDPSWYPLGGVEPLVYTFAAGTSFLVAVLAGVPSARRAAAVQPMIAMRSE